MFKSKCPKSWCSFFALLLLFSGALMCPLLCFLLMLCHSCYKSSSHGLAWKYFLFMKVKIVHYLRFQLKWGKYQGEEKHSHWKYVDNKLKGNNRTKAHRFIFTLPTHWIPVPTLSPSSCCFTTVSILQLHSSALTFVRKWCF